VGLTTVLLAGQLAFHLEPAGSEAFLDLYTGKSFTEPSDLHVRQRNIGDDFRFTPTAAARSRLGSATNSTPERSPLSAREIGPEQYLPSP
jgi:hypothetical protein